MAQFKWMTFRVRHRIRKPSVSNSVHWLASKPHEAEVQQL